jgi:hypothetical protein
VNLDYVVGLPTGILPKPSQGYEKTSDDAITNLATDRNLDPNFRVVWTGWHGRWAGDFPR